MSTLPSLVRGIFAGVIHDTLIFPYPPSLEQRDPGEAALVRRLVGTLREIQAALVDPAKFDEEETIGEPVIRALAEHGFLSLTIPREYGGLELSATAYARIFGEISRMDSSLAVLVGVHCGLGSKAIALFGTPEQKARYLPMLARGETLAAYALTEPETGSDAQNIKTRARLSDDGTHWLLNGHKQWIGNAHRAGVIVTFAQTETARPDGTTASRVSAFIIRPDMPGFKVLGTFRKLGIRGSTQAELLYTDLRVPADHVLAPVGKGFSVAVRVLNGGRFTLAAGCTAGTKEILTEMTSFAERRVQFGKPIAEFEITQRKLARTAADIYTGDAMLGVLADLSRQPDADLALEAACCKVFTSEMLWRAADEMVQVAGGRGFVKPYPYERMLRDSRINRIFEGTNEILRLFIALNGIQGPAEHLKEVGSALRQPLRHLGLITGFAASRVRGVLGATPTLDAHLDPRLQRHKRYFERHVAELSAAAQRLIQRYRQGIVDRQQELERLADMAIELFATACVLSRTQDLIQARGLAAVGYELNLCDLAVVESGRRFRAQRVQLESPQDGVRLSVAASVRAAGGYGVTDAILHAGHVATDTQLHPPAKP